MVEHSLFRPRPRLFLSKVILSSLEPQPLILPIRIELENRLAYIANTDVLTEISNRRHFFTLATQKVETEKQLSLLMLDIDHFKHVNDKFGHDAGDDVLKYIASNLQQNLPTRGNFSKIGR